MLRKSLVGKKGAGSVYSSFRNFITEYHSSTNLKYFNKIVFISLINTLYRKWRCHKDLHKILKKVLS